MAEDRGEELDRVAAEVVALVEEMFRTGAVGRIEVPVNGRMRRCGTPEPVGPIRPLPECAP